MNCSRGVEPRTVPLRWELSHNEEPISVTPTPPSLEGERAEVPRYAEGHRACVRRVEPRPGGEEGRLGRGDRRLPVSPKSD